MASHGKSRRRKEYTRTKIVATLGPATHDLASVKKLIRAGVDVFRLNFSHGTHKQHAAAIRWIRRAARAGNRPIGILADLQGPKIRVGKLADGEPLFLKKGESLTIVSDDELVGGPGRIGCTYPDLHKDVKPGERILLDDGNIELRVDGVEGGEVHTTVRYGGLLREHKGVNLPGTQLKAPALGGKDLFDLEFALSHNVDFVALSFVRRPAEVRRLRKRIHEFGGDAAVIAKIERPEAVERIDQIVGAADGVMVARGDMGVEVGTENVPLIQKRIIELCTKAGKPVITATQMLESMVDSPRPTRAEASDVANAVFDGTSALMLSAETASGKFPVLAVQTMERIARHTEAELYPDDRQGFKRRRTQLRRTSGAISIQEATVSAAARAALESDAEAIVVFTESGRTARLVSRERLATRFYAFTPSPRTYTQMSLLWGIIPLMTQKARSVERLFVDAENELVQRRHVKRGQRVVFVSGALEVTGATNTVQIREIAASRSDR